MSEPLVRARGLRMAFAGVEVVKGVDIDLFPGEVHAIVGENGAGKSTVGKIVAGVYRPTAGTLNVMGRETAIESPRHAIDLGIALIHQEPLTFPDLDVAENIFVGHQPVRGPLRRVDWGAMREQAGKILDELGVRLRPDARVGTLSVADQQMVELASALSHDAKVLMMDETTASLTPKEVSELFAIVRRLRDQGRAITFVSHHLDEVMEIADRVTVMRDGEKVAELNPKETNVAEIVRLMVGRSLSGAGVPPANDNHATEPPQPLISVSNLTLPGRFENVSFEVRPGEIVGLAGLVGAGRTDVCQALFGITHPSGGEIKIGGQPVKIRNPREAMAHGVALVPEDRQHEGLLMPMSLAQNANLATLRLVSKGPWLREKKEASLAEETLAKLQTAFRTVSQPVRELSGGNQQKVVLSKWLLSEPKLLILDEPTRGVDVGAKDEVHRLMRQLADQGMAILMVSSDLPEVLALSDRILVMREGRLVAEIVGHEANAERVMFAATGQATTTH